MPRDLCILEFIERARAIHGYRYDYGAARYRGVDNPIEIICRPHGTFETTPNRHLIGDGCPKCQPKP